MTLEAEKTEKLDAGGRVPRHIAIIMDGNGRWAQARGLPRLEGHRAGTENIRRILKRAGELGIEYMTIYAFSTENWGRPDDEVSGLLEILGGVIRDEVVELHKSNVRVLHLGSLDRVPEALAGSIRQSVEMTKNNTGLTLCVAFDYGGRAEIVHAVRQIVASGMRPEDVNEGAIEANLYLPRVPDPDMIVRTAGEQRISNFLIWQAAYAEYYRTEVCWPDFDDGELTRAVEEYGRRKRSFGKLPPSH